MPFQGQGSLGHGDVDPAIGVRLQSLAGMNNRLGSKIDAAAGEAVDRARSGGGPTLIERMMYRVAMHTTADDPKRYRSKAQLARDLSSRNEEAEHG